jgi:kynurenine formamidase
MLAGVGCAAGHSRLDRLAWEQSRFIDLTHSFGADTIVWPTEQDFRLVLQQAGEAPGGYYYASNRLEMAEQWETAHGRIPSRAIVLLDTGFAQSWPSRQQYLGTELRGPEAVRALHFPGLHPEAAAWLVRERQVKAVGIDTASIDYGQSSNF